MMDEICWVVESSLKTNVIPMAPVKPVTYRI